MRPRIVFGVQSAVHQAATLAQLVRALGDHTVIVHHDFSQQPDFVVDAPNVRFVAEPARTGWADWGLTVGILKTIEQALAEQPFDYFQLLSPVDMPIRPMSEFEQMVSARMVDFHADTIDIEADEVAFMTFAYRAYAREGSVGYRLLWRLREVYFGKGYRTENRGGLSLPVSGERGTDGSLTPSARWARRATQVVVNRLKRRDPSLVAQPIHVGSMWFGASRRGCEFLVDAFRKPDVVARFKPFFCSGEMLFSTVFANAGLPIGPANHVVSPFVGARPEWLKVDDLDWLRRSGSYFARKFPDDPEDPVRLRLLEQIGVK